MKFYKIFKRDKLVSYSFFFSSRFVFFNTKNIEKYVKINFFSKCFSKKNKFNTKLLNLFFPSKTLVNSFYCCLKENFLTIAFGYFFELNLRGVGFKCYYLIDNKLIISLGFSHFIIVSIPSEIFIFLKKGKIFLYGVSKQLVNKTINDICALRIPDPYVGKGVIEIGKLFVLKEGKKR